MKRLPRIRKPRYRWTGADWRVRLVDSYLAWRMRLPRVMHTRFTLYSCVVIEHERPRLRVIDGGRA